MGQAHKIDCIVRPISLSFGDFFHAKYPSEILLRFLLLNGQFAHNYFHLPDTCWGNETIIIRVLQVSNWLYPITLSFRRMLLPNCFKTILQRAHFIIMARASCSLLLNHSCHLPWNIKICSDKWVNWNAVLFCRIDIFKTDFMPNQIFTEPEYQCLLSNLAKQDPVLFSIRNIEIPFQNVPQKCYLIPRTNMW